MIFTLLSIAILLVPTTSTIGRALNNNAKWTAKCFLHTLVFALSGLQSLIQISIFQTAMNLVLQISMVWICLYWPRFYFSPFKSKYNWRPIWEILSTRFLLMDAKLENHQIISFVWIKTFIASSTTRLKERTSILTKYGRNIQTRRKPQRLPSSTKMILFICQYHIRSSWNSC